MVSNPNLTSFDNEIPKKFKKIQNKFSELISSKEFIPTEICVKSTLLLGRSFYKTVCLSVMSHITKFKPKTGFV